MESFGLLVGYVSEALPRVFGVLGFLTYVSTYLMVSLRVITSEYIAFYLLNTLAASLMLFSLAQDFNLGSALIQSFWIVIGIMAIALRVGRGPVGR